MDNEKTGGKEGTTGQESSTRARNRTVMLTPEITGQVRARLQQELDPGSSGHAQPNQSPAGHSHQSGGVPRDSGFESVAGRSFSGAPSYGEPAPHSSPAPRASAQAPVPAGGAGIMWTKESPVVGFLVSFDANPNGDVYILRTGRLMVTFGHGPADNSLVLDDSSVSPMHAILRIGAEGDIQVLDQLSEFGTKIRRYGSAEEEELSGDKGTLKHGDVVRFGSRSFHVCLVSREVEESAE